jgi:hypothetical protein
MARTLLLSKAGVEELLRVLQLGTLRECQPYGALEHLADADPPCCDAMSLPPYLPHSGFVLAELGDELAGYECTSGSLHFAIDRPLPDDLIRRLVEAKLALLTS